MFERMSDNRATTSTPTRRRLGSVATATLAAVLQNAACAGRSCRAGADQARAADGRAGTDVRYLPMREDLVETSRRASTCNAPRSSRCKPGEVLVIDARNDTEAGTIGDIFALRAIQLGASASSPTARARPAALRRLDVAVYDRASHGATFRRMHMPVDQQVPIACAGVTVVPGDMIVGDEDGVVVVPAALAHDVAAEAEQQELEERGEWSASPPARAPTARSRSHRPDARSSRRGRRPDGRGVTHDPALVRRRVDAHTQPDPGGQPRRPTRGVEHHRRARPQRRPFPSRSRRNSPTSSITSARCCTRRAPTGTTWRR